MGVLWPWMNTGAAGRSVTPAPRIYDIRNTQRTTSAWLLLRRFHLRRCERARMFATVKSGFLENVGAGTLLSGGVLLPFTWPAPAGSPPSLSAGGLNVKTTSFATSMNRLRSVRRTALLAASHWDDVRLAAPGLADSHGLLTPSVDPKQLEMRLSSQAPPS